MPSSNDLITLAQNRRTIYALGKTSPISDLDNKIEELVNAAIHHVPSSFNTQSTRLVVLLHAEHERLWDLIIETFEGGLVKTGKVNEEVWRGQTLSKLEGMRNGIGTVSFPLRPNLLRIEVGFGGVCEMLIGFVNCRSSSTKIRRISSPFPRNSPSTRTISSPGLSIRMPCINTSVRLQPLSPFPLPPHPHPP